MHHKISVFDISKLFGFWFSPRPSPPNVKLLLFLNFLVAYSSKTNVKLVWFQTRSNFKIFFLNLEPSVHRYTSVFFGKCIGFHIFTVNQVKEFISFILNHKQCISQARVNQLDQNPSIERWRFMDYIKFSIKRKWVIYRLCKIFNLKQGWKDKWPIFTFVS